MSYRTLINGATSAFSASLSAIDTSSGAVTINGVLAPPAAASGPFTFTWGDGTTTTRFFPATHTYADRTQNYIAAVAAADTAGHQYLTQVVVRFADAAVTTRELPPDLKVTVPAAPPVLSSPQPGLGVPALSAFATIPYSRSVLEYVLSAAAKVQNDLVGGDVVRTDGTFRQVVLRQDTFTPSTSFSVWSTLPVAVAAGPSVLQGAPSWSSLFHEMGHNVTLNMPAPFRFGGRIDGAANALYSEMMAQVFQHVTSQLLVTNAAAYGIPDDLALEIRQSAYGSFATLRSNAESLRTGAESFSAWNDPATSTDETLPTFMCLAYEFFLQADPDGANYHECAQRLCAFLRHFDAAWQAGWAQNTNSAAASSFRATLMVAALSTGVGRDLRATFKSYGFPIDDTTYLVTIAKGTDAQPSPPVIASPPLGQAAVTGQPVAFTVVASGSPASLFQWNKNGISISGATNATLTLPSVQASDAGSYTVVVTNAVGSATSNAAVLTIGPPTSAARLINLSILTSIAPGETMTLGTVLGGAGTSGAKPLVARAAGPALSAFGVTGTLPDPKMALIAAGTGATVATNNDWNGDPALSDAFAQVGAFAYTSPGSKDAGIYQPGLAPGSYTAQVVDNASGSGIVIAELYDATPGGAFTAITPRLINVSVLKQIAVGATLTAGFVIGGSTSKTILVRAIGPTLGAAPPIGFGLGGTMADPKLELFNNTTSTKIYENNDWATPVSPLTTNAAQLTATFTSVGAFQLANTATKDAVLFVTLAPGQYSARVGDADGGGGTAIVEVYEVP